jgi:nitrite reductase/ring-hydroxylating ferredoxin subunit
VGGVALNLENAQEVSSAAQAILTRAAERRPDARIDGFTVQPMVRRPRALELIVGASIDPLFGPVLLFGQGGTAVEVVADQPTPTLIPLESLRIGRDPVSEGWAKVGPAADIAVDELTAVSLAGDRGQPTDVLIVNVGQRLSAYRNECAHEALPLTDAMLDLSNGTLTCPWHGFCFDASSGECLSAPGAQLEQLPLRIDDGDVWVRVGQ